MAIKRNNGYKPTGKPIGRPKTDKKGAMVWVAAELLDAVNAYIELLKQQQNKQAKQ